MNKRRNVLLKALAVILLVFLSNQIFGQTDSRYNTGLNLPFNEKAGDVDPQTGDLIIRDIDFSLPGRGGFNFEYGRIWSSSQANVFNMYYNGDDNTNRLDSNTLERISNMGVGWSSTVPYILKDSSSGRLVMTLFLNGRAYELDQTGITIRNLQQSNIIGYDLLDLRVYEDRSKNYGSISTLNFDTIIKGTYATVVADLKTDTSQYVLYFKDNSKMWFRPDGRLMAHEDKTGLNRICYYYNSTKQLSLATDSVNRVIRFNYNTTSSTIASINIQYLSVGIKNTDGTRTYIASATKTIGYTYYDLESQFPELVTFKTNITGYIKPMALKSVSVKMYTSASILEHNYHYSLGKGRFTFNNNTPGMQVAENYYLLLCTDLTFPATINTLSKFKNSRNFEYQVPARGMYTKYFYNGFMEYFKVTRQYYYDRNARIIAWVNKLPNYYGDVIADTRYEYYENGENGNSNSYSTVISIGNTRTTYLYSLDAAANKYHTLQNKKIETNDGYKEYSQFSYDSNRTKILEEIWKNGTFAYHERHWYAKNGSLLKSINRQGLIMTYEYDPIFSIPVRITKTLTVDGITKNYDQESIINNLGQVIETRNYLENNEKRIIPLTTTYEYDAYNNLICITNPQGHKSHTEYDVANRCFPIKTWTDVQVSLWSTNDKTQEPDRVDHVIFRSWRVFNTDGTVWLDIDNDGYVTEHYYSTMQDEIETVLPDADDGTIPLVLKADSNGNPLTTEFSDFRSTTYYTSIMSKRQNNPGIRKEIDYAQDFTKTFTDLNKANNQVKIVSVQKDGLNHVEEETEHNGVELYTKKMVYNQLGWMVSLTDQDAVNKISDVDVNSKTVARFDKTWITKYDDLGRKILVLYPSTQPGVNAIKTIRYNDEENSVTTTDPEKRTFYEKYDWSGNLIKSISTGDPQTSSSETLVYEYRYDELNRKISFKDPMGNEVTYHYDERNLLVEQNYGEDNEIGAGSDNMHYNELGQLVEKYDRKRQRIAFKYDEMGRLIETSYFFADGSKDYTLKTAYDNRGNVNWISNKNLIEEYTYNARNLLAQHKRYIKDATIRGTLAKGLVTDGNLNFQYQYNDMGQITSMTYPDASIHQFNYDPVLARLSSIQETDRDELILQAFIPSIQYNKSGVAARMDYSNGVYQTWDFDNRKRINRIKIMSPTNTVIEELNYTLNTDGDILKINENEYQYDGFDRIISAKTKLPGKEDKLKLVKLHFGAVKDQIYPDGLTYNLKADVFPTPTPDGIIDGADLVYASYDDHSLVYDTETYAYDQNGNRIRLTQLGISEKNEKYNHEYSYEYGKRNRLDKIWIKENGSPTRRLFVEYSYDKNGNIIKRIINKNDATTEIIDFTYDILNRLTKTVTTTKTRSQTTSKSLEYFYDNAGNRFIKTGTTGTTVYLRHGQIAVAMDVDIPVSQPEATTDTLTINRYVLSGDLLSGRVTKNISISKTDNTRTLLSTKKSWYQLDHLNSTKCVTDNAAQVEVNYHYRVFGEQLRKLNKDNQNTTDLAKYSYGGKELDDNTNLYYFNARYYDATIGRFINVDPVQDGSNWYIYCQNNPLSFKDPTGLDPDESINRLETIKTEAKKVKDDLTFAKGLLAYSKALTPLGVAAVTALNAGVGKAVGAAASAILVSAISLERQIDDTAEKTKNLIRESDEMVKDLKRIKNESIDVELKNEELQTQIFLEKQEIEMANQEKREAEEMYLESVMEYENPGNTAACTIDENNESQCVLIPIPDYEEPMESRE